MNALAILLSLLAALVAGPSEWPHRGEGKVTDIYRQVPKEQRELLRKAVEELLEAERRGDWERVFELIEKHPRQTRSDFLKEAKTGSPLREFVPTAVTFFRDDESWAIHGCASFDGDPKNTGHDSSIHARWKDSRWYLSPVAIRLFKEKDKSGARECSTVR